MSIGVFMPMIVGGKATAKGKPWTLRNNPTLSSGRVWKCFAYGNGVFVALTNKFSVYRPDGMISSDGINWTSITPPDIANEGLSFVQGSFFLMGKGSLTGYSMFSSENGVDWTGKALRNIDSLNKLKSMVFGNDLFVAVGGSGRIYTSSTSNSWTERTAPSSNTNDWKTIAFGNGVFVALASTGTRRLMTSNDGINWTLRASPDDTIEWQSVIFAKGKFVAVGFSGAIATSTDGINWILIPLLQDLPNNWTSVTYGNGRFVAVSSSGDKRVAISTNGLNWILTDAAVAGSWIEVAYGDGIFASIRSAGTTGTSIMTAP